MNEVKKNVEREFVVKVLRDVSSNQKKRLFNSQTTMKLTYRYKRRHCGWAKGCKSKRYIKGIQKRNIILFTLLVDLRQGPSGYVNDHVYSLQNEFLMSHFWYSIDSLL